MFGLAAEAVFPAVLVFRLIGFWLPIPLGVAAYLKLLQHGPRMGGGAPRR